MPLGPEAKLAAKWAQQLTPVTVPLQLGGNLRHHRRRAEERRDSVWRWGLGVTLLRLTIGSGVLFQRVFCLLKNADPKSVQIAEMSPSLCTDLDPTL